MPGRQRARSGIGPRKRPVIDEVGGSWAGRRQKAQSCPAIKAARKRYFVIGMALPSRLQARFLKSFAGVLIIRVVLRAFIFIREECSPLMFTNLLNPGTITVVFGYIF